jgi:hypothetical protein
VDSYQEGARKGRREIHQRQAAWSNDEEVIALKFLLATQLADCPLNSLETLDFSDFWDR